MFNTRRDASANFQTFNRRSKPSSKPHLLPTPFPIQHASKFTSTALYINVTINLAFNFRAHFIFGASNPITFRTSEMRMAVLLLTNFELRYPNFPKESH